MSPLEAKTTLLRWAGEAPSRFVPIEAALNRADEAKKPLVQLPGNNRLLAEFAVELGEHLSTTELYSRSGVAMRLNPHTQTLEPISPKRFASWLENHVVLWIPGPAETRVKKSITTEEAGRVLDSDHFCKSLREVDRINPVRLPVLRANGAIELLQDGFDAESRTLTLGGIGYPLDVSFSDAVKLLADLISEFPFSFEPIGENDEPKGTSDDRNKAVALAAMFSMYARGLLPQDSLAPVFLYMANTEGAGKSLLASLAVIPTHGQMAVQSQPRDEEKCRQELLALVISAKKYIAFDNWRGAVASSALEGFVTCTRYGGRLMRENIYWEGRKECDVIITGNGCVVNGDMRRRSLQCDLFVSEAKSEERAIKKRMDPRGIEALRPKILGALWSVVKFWDSNKRPPCTKEHGSFAAWAATIGGIVETGFGYCCIGESRSTSAGDLQLQHMTRLCEEAVSVTDKEDRYTVQELVDLAIAHSLFEEIIEVEDGKLTAKARSLFGKTLKRFDNRVFKRSIKMFASGSGHARRYVFQRLT